ncbi:MAG: sigma-54 dependent transcriptional regulator [Burkholderiales bacterium]
MPSAVTDTLLLIEDEDLLGDELARHLRREGWDVARARTIAEARRLLVERAIDPLVVLSDMSLPDGNALDLLESLAAHGARGEWIVLTGYGTIGDSVRGVRLGAYDFLEKPCDLERLDLVVAGAARSGRAQRRIREQSAEQNRRYGLEAFGGRSAAARRVRELLAKLAAVPFSALLLSGETGTGKGLAARILHYSGLRREGPLVEINCAALPRELLESELFGHEAGAFTGAKGRRRGLLEQAHGGTLFLDEIGEMERELQAKLLKAIEDRRFRRVGGNDEVAVDVQFVASSNRDLAERVQEGAFRADLFHRLGVFSVGLPALRERREDVPELVPLFVAEFNAKAGKAVRTIPDEVWARLLAHDWPGNVRELRNVVERCVLLAEGEVFPAQWLHLGRDATASGAEAAAFDGRHLALPLDGTMTLEEMDRRIIQTALERSGHNATAAARLLGSTRQTLRYRIEKYGLKSDG